jgi:hypothetical protein
MNIDDARRIALRIARDAGDEGDEAFSVGARKFAWPWLERVDPRKARVVNESVLAVRTASEDEKLALIDLDSTMFFTEPHYDGYAAVLVRLASVDEVVLTDLLANARRLAAAKRRRTRTCRSA